MTTAQFIVFHFFFSQKWISLVKVKINFPNYFSPPVFIYMFLHSMWISFFIGWNRFWLKTEQSKQQPISKLYIYFPTISFLAISTCNLFSCLVFCTNAFLFFPSEQLFPNNFPPLACRWKTRQQCRWKLAQVHECKIVRI